MSLHVDKRQNWVNCRTPAGVREALGVRTPHTFGDQSVRSEAARRGQKYSGRRIAERHRRGFPILWHICPFPLPSTPNTSYQGWLFIRCKHEGTGPVHSCYKPTANSFGASFMWKKRIFKQHQAEPRWVTSLKGRSWESKPTSSPPGQSSLLIMSG